MNDVLAGAVDRCPITKVLRNVEEGYEYVY